MPELEESEDSRWIIVLRPCHNSDDNGDGDNGDNGDNADDNDDDDDDDDDDDNGDDTDDGTSRNYKTKDTSSNCVPKKQNHHGFYTNSWSTDLDELGEPQ